MQQNLAAIPDTRWSSYSTGYESRFANGTATITLKQLKLEWSGWNADERRDFCLAYSFGLDTRDRCKVIRFLVRNGAHDCWQAMAHCVPLNLWPAEATEILIRWIKSSKRGSASHYIHALGHLRWCQNSEEEATEATRFLRRFLQELLLSPKLVDTSDHYNDLAYDALACVESLLVLGEDRESLRGVYHLLKHHPCDEIRRLTTHCLDEHFPSDKQQSTWRRDDRG